MRPQKPLPILRALEDDPLLQANIDAVESRVKRTLETAALGQALQKHNQPSAASHQSHRDESRAWRLR